MWDHTSIGNETTALSEPRDHAPAFNTFSVTISDKETTVHCCVYIATKNVCMESHTSNTISLLFQFVLEFLIEIFTDFDVLEHSGQFIDIVCWHPNLLSYKWRREMKWKVCKLQHCDWPSATQPYSLPFQSPQKCPKWDDELDEICDICTWQHVMDI